MIRDRTPYKLEILKRGVLRERVVAHVTYTTLSTLWLKKRKRQREVAASFFS